MSRESFNIEDSGAHPMPPDIAAASLAGSEWGGVGAEETPDVSAGYNEPGKEAGVEMSPDEQLAEMVSGAQTIEGLARELRQSGMETESASVETVLHAFAKSPDKPTVKAPLMKLITSKGGLRAKVAELFSQGKLFERERKLAEMVSGAQTIEGLARALVDSGDSAMEDVSDNIKIAFETFASPVAEQAAREASLEKIADDFGIRAKVAELLNQGKIFEQGAN